MRTLLSRQVLNTMRRTMYGAGAVLRFYKLPTGAAPELLTTVTDGWYVQRQSYTQGTEAEPKQSKLLLAKGAVTDALLHRASRCEVDVNGYTFRFNFDDKASFQQLGTGWLIPLTQVDVQQEV